MILNKIEQTILGKLLRPAIRAIKRKSCKHPTSDLVRICLTNDYSEYWCRHCDTIIKVDKPKQ